MTVQEAINRIDEQVPNAVSPRQKEQWLADLERGMALSFPIPGDLAGGLAGELRIPQPWDSLYVYYLEANIYYAQGDIARFNQANAMYESVRKGYGDYYHRSHLQPEKNIQYF